jgi:hypothetical protein
VVFFSFLKMDRSIAKAMNDEGDGTRRGRVPKCCLV